MCKCLSVFLWTYLSNPCSAPFTPTELLRLITKRIISFRIRVRPPGLSSDSFLTVAKTNIKYDTNYHTVTRKDRPDPVIMCLMPYANKKGVDQPAHPHSLISTFVVRCLNNTIHTCYIQSCMILASFCSWAGWFESYLVENPRRHVFVWCGSDRDFATHLINWASQVWSLTSPDLTPESQLLV